MKKITITLTHVLEVPDDVEILRGGVVDVLKWGRHYLAPNVEYMESEAFSKREMRFHEISEEAFELVCGALKRDTTRVDEG